MFIPRLEDGSDLAHFFLFSLTTHADLVLPGRLLGFQRQFQGPRALFLLSSPVFHCRLRHAASRLNNPVCSGPDQPFALNVKASRNPPLANMAAATNATCPGGDSAIPDAFSLPIPQNINVMVRTGSNASNHAMEVCCAPNRVQVTTGCPYLWCELPRRFFNESSDPAYVGVKVSACLRSAANFTDGDSRGTVFQFNAGARAGTATAKQMGLWVLLVSGLISYLL